MPTCEICGSSAKNPKYFFTKKHIDSKKHQKALNRGSTKSLRPGKLTVSTQPSLATTQLEPRVAALESTISSLTSKVEFLIEEFAAFQKKSPVKYSQQQSVGLNQSQIIEIMDRYTQTKRSKGNWITISELFSTVPLEPADWSTFQATLIKMFDRGLIELIDGTSKRKLTMRGRKYGLVRRKK